MIVETARLKMGDETVDQSADCRNCEYDVDEVEFVFHESGF